jgi:hypothetical protein
MALPLNTGANFPTRVADFALLMGHAWRCTACREKLLENPSLAWIGYKLDEAQRTAILKLTDDSFQTVPRLAAQLSLPVRELEAAIDHPRARLRHLEGRKYDLHIIQNRL